MRRIKGGRAVIAGIAVLTLATGLAACGGDDDDDDASASASATEGEAEEADLDAACDTNLEIEQAFVGLEEAEDAEALKAAIAESGVVHLVTELESQAPDEIAADVAAGAEAVRATGERGDPAALQEFDSSAIDEYFYENCDYVTAAVTAKDYSFEGMPDELDAGDLDIKFTNEGTEFHHIVVVRKNDGVTESWEELLAMPEEESDAKVTFVTETAAPPGDTSFGTGTLEPGEHIAVCFIPQGTVGDTEGTGPPHAMLGMTHEFTVA